MVQPKARELILGLADDPTFGTVDRVRPRRHRGRDHQRQGAGAAAARPATGPRSLIERTRVSRLLRAYRDVPAVKEDAVAMVLVKLSQMAADIPEIHELDINPLLADRSGVLAVDARIAIGARGRQSSPARVLPTSRCGPIRRNGSGIIEVEDGWRLFVRPIRPEDEPVIHEFLRHVTSHDLRLRFFAAMKEFSHEFVARLTQLDYARAMAFVAFDEATGEMVGAVGFIRTQSTRAENMRSC